MTRARTPRPAEIQAAARDPRLNAARIAKPDTAWRTRGRCLTVDGDAFFPSGNDNAEMAVALCRGCDVQALCLAWALDTRDNDGVYGATTARERRAMLPTWRAAAAGIMP